MSDSHGGTGTQGQNTSHVSGGASKSSPRRLVILTLIMLGFAAASFLPPLFSRGGTGVSNTSGNLPNFFIPIWISLTITTVVISMWFTRFLMIAERYRDSESPSPSHSH